MTILDKRLTYRPFEYQLAFDSWRRNRDAFWHADLVPLVADLQDWNNTLNTLQREVAGRILKGFTQTEILVENYWLTAVRWFGHPEVRMMITQFAEAEGRHIHAYNKLVEELGMEEYDAFAEAPAIAKRISYFVDVKDGSLYEKARSLAVFSGFCEGVSLFSAFAILLHFRSQNLLKGVGDIIEWSIKDESEHAAGGIWLYQTLLKEFPELDTPELKADIYDACDDILTLEMAYIDYVFEMGSIQGLSATDLKNFIKMRANSRLFELGLEPIISYDAASAAPVNKMFTEQTKMPAQTDFFSGVEPNYSKTALDQSVLTWDTKALINFQ